MAEGAGCGRAMRAPTGRVLGVTAYDAETGTLYLETEANEDGAEADLTDDEMIVVRNGIGDVVSVTVPFVDTHWLHHVSELMVALSRFGQITEGEVRRSIGLASGDRPPVFMSYSVALSAGSGDYRVSMSSNPRSTPYAPAQVARTVV
jgi:hypothetical protein